MSIMRRMPVVLAVVMITSAACSPTVPPVSGVTIQSSAEFQKIPLQPASFSEIVPAPEFGAVSVGEDYTLQPVVPSAPIGISAATKVTGKPMVTAIARTIEYRPVPAHSRSWAGQTVYGTSFSDHPLVAR